jgi:hypothetical protein
MEEWFIIQSFYHWLIHSAQEHIDVAAGGSLFALSIEEACKLVEKMASNQSWDELEEVDMLTTKTDLLMKKLENPGLNHHKMVDARVTCEECGKWLTWASTTRQSLKMSTLLVIPSMIFVLIKASMLGGTNPASLLTTTNRVVVGRISTEMSPLSEISSGIR